LADDVETTPALGLNDTASRVIARLMTRDVAIGLAFAVLAFIAYWYLGPQQTAYSFQVTQANNIVNGHLDLRPEHSLNLGILERVLYDGDRFCLPVGDEAKLPTIVEYNEAIAEGATQDEAARSIISADCRLYMQHSLGPSLMVIPGVLVWGKELNQAAVSAVIGAFTAVVVWAIARKLSEDLLTQISLTALMLFGTIFWWVAANGGVWFFAHTTAVFFLFCAIYFTVVRRNPLAAGALLGAAYLCRPPVIMTGLFFVIMFADLWLKTNGEGRDIRASLRRVNWRPIAQFAGGLAPVLLLAAILNYARYDNPVEYGYNYVESSHQTYLAFQYRYGNLDLRYLDLHPPVIFGGMPLFQQAGPYVLPSWFGAAIWVTTPAFLLAYFADIKKYLIPTVICASVLALSCAFLMSRAIAAAWHTGWSTVDPPENVHLLPFLLMVGVAIGAGLCLRNRLTLACWAAIIPTAMVLFSFAFVGYTQFGYRYSLDFMPFLWLLVAYAIGDKVRWYHLALIALSIVVNAWGVLWIYHLDDPATVQDVNNWLHFRIEAPLPFLPNPGFTVDFPDIPSSWEEWARF
jgi:hypothetical protein